MTGSDNSDYTLEMRLCDDDGMVSRAQTEHGVTGLTYLDVLNNLRAHTSPQGEHKRIEEPFACTGSAHLAGEHIRCTSPAHAATDWWPLDNALCEGMPIVVTSEHHTFDKDRL